MGSPGLLHDVWLWAGTEPGKSQGPRVDGYGRSLPQPFSPFLHVQLSKIRRFFPCNVHRPQTGFLCFLLVWGGWRGGAQPFSWGLTHARPQRPGPQPCCSSALGKFRAKLA